MSARRPLLLGKAATDLCWLLDSSRGHIYAFYLEYVYYDRRRQGAVGLMYNRPAPGMYSDNIQSGGYPALTGYGTMQ
jgi:hypothetical protein